MKILIIDNHIDQKDWGASTLIRFASQIPEATFYVRRAPEEDLPVNPGQFDYIIVSGSKTSAFAQDPWVHKLLEFTRAAIDRKKPFLGICYGEQVLALALGEPTCVRKAHVPEVGWTEIEVMDSSSIFEGLPPHFHTFSSHFEEVHQLAPSLKRLARSKDCGTQAIQFENLPIFGVQFHPEKTPADAEETFADIREQKGPIDLLNVDRGPELYMPKVGETILKNFIKLGKK